MNRQVWMVVVALIAWPVTANAQSAGGSDQQQSLGSRLFNQSCIVCHLNPQLGATTYAPNLSQNTLGGKADIMREVIENGTPRMPGFKHHFKPAEIDAIVAYIKTLPAPVAAAPPAAKTGASRDAD